MKPSRLRRQIAWEAARLILEQPDMTNSAACQEVVQQLFPQGVNLRDLPSASEIGEQLRAFERRLQPNGWEDRFAVYAELLQPLADVMQDPQMHPEGDALYHSLQVFQLVAEEYPYDEELLTAALLHDVGKAIDRRDHHGATLVALAGIVTERTLWLIEQLPTAQSLLQGRLGARARNRLESSDDRDELIFLAKCDAAGRVRGAVVPELEEALALLSELHGADPEGG
jgi:hypothetical protein